jgi:hypothetical protein
MTPNPAMANDREQNMNDGTLQVGQNANLLRSAATLKLTPAEPGGADPAERLQTDAPQVPR